MFSVIFLLAFFVIFATFKDKLRAGGARHVIRHRHLAGNSKDSLRADLAIPVRCGGKVAPFVDYKSPVDFWV